MYHPVKIHEVDVSVSTSNPVPPYHLFTPENVAKIDAYLMNKFHDEDVWAKLSANTAVVKEAWPVGDWERGMLLACYVDLRRTNWNFYRNSRGSCSYGVEPYTPGTPIVSPRRWCVEDWYHVRKFIDEQLLQHESIKLSVNSIRTLPLQTRVGYLHQMLACLLAYDGYVYEYDGLHNEMVSEYSHHSLHSYVIHRKEAAE